jgi:hypothetical protein
MDLKGVECEVMDRDSFGAGWEQAAGSGNFLVP